MSETYWERVELCQRRRIENWVKAEWCTCSVFLSARQLNTTSLSSSNVLDWVSHCLSAYYHKVWAAASHFFSQNPDFSPSFAPYFPQVFAFNIFFWNFRLFLHISATSAFYHKLLAKCASCGSKCIVMWVKQTGLASETLFWRSKHFDLLRIVGRKDWTQTERAGWPAGGSTTGWVSD